MRQAIIWINNDPVHWPSHTRHKTSRTKIIRSWMTSHLPIPANNMHFLHTSLVINIPIVCRIIIRTRNIYEIHAPHVINAFPQKFDFRQAKWTFPVIKGLQRNNRCIQNWGNRTFLKLTHPPGQNGRLFADDIFRCIFVNEKFIFRLKFHWSLFLRVQLTITRHWFR